jgi:HSP20 family protein
MTLVKFNPETKNSPLLPGFNDIIGPVLADTFFTDRHQAGLPPANISESSAAYHIELAAPGLKKEDFRVSLDGEVLSISADRKNADSIGGKTYKRREFSYSPFTRLFTLPESADVEGIRACYTDGVLSLDIPKKEEARAVSRQIEIQ